MGLRIRINMLRFATLLAVSTVCTLAMPAAHTEFADFKAAYNKSYSSLQQEINRLRIFEANLIKIVAHNKDPRWTYTLGVNDVSVSDLPASLDWRDKKVVTAPKNQGGCGSRWAFSTAETLESHIAIQTGKLLEFSPQEYVSCAPNPKHCGGTGGCQGSTQILGFQYAIKTGITLDKSYPYQGSTGTCDPSKIKPVAKITGYVKLAANNYTALMNAVVSQGPIAISAAAEPWQLYSGGVYDGACGTDVDHAIQLVGYGTQPKSSRALLGGSGSGSGDYWLGRNSWGASWGEKGYIRIQRFGEGKEPCAQDKKPADGFGCTGGPASVQVCGVCGLMSESSYPTGGSLV